jgi:hypothetical protein
MSVGAEQYQGSVNIRLEEINNCGQVLNDLVILDCSESGKSGWLELAREIGDRRSWLWIPGSPLRGAPE